MHFIRSSVRTFGVVCFAALAAACGDDDGTGPSLTPERVGGTYNVCSLAFNPTNDLLPDVDVLASAVNLEPGSQPQLRLSTQTSDFVFEFIEEGDVIREQLRGTYSGSGNRVTLDFRGGSVSPSSLLLNQRLGLDFQAEPKALLSPAADAQTLYTVSRSRYAELADVSEEGLANPIPGTLSARFTAGACS